MNMQIVAESKSVRVSPRKARLVADVIRRMSATDAVKTLSIISKRVGIPLEKTLKSAIANAVYNNQLSEENLVIERIDISEGQAMKRYQPSTRGRTHPYKKRTSHIRIVLKDKTTDSKPEVKNKKDELKKEGEEK